MSRPDPITIAFSLTEAKRFLRHLQDSNFGCVSQFVRGVEDLLKQQITEREATPVAPWRKVIGRERGNTGVNIYENLECGHRYRLRSSKNWIEDHATKRRCEKCLKAAAP